MAMLRRVEPADVRAPAKPAVDADALKVASEIIADVRAQGEAAVRRYAERFGERASGEPLLLERAELERALDAIDATDWALLERVAGRIESFARSQRDAIHDVAVEEPWGRAGHTVEPIRRAACYAPGGGYPLPSTALMTAVTARVAGCERVRVVSPGGHPMTLAAAAVAGADELLAIGGAHAVATCAIGISGIDRDDIFVGPGNKFVTAAKQLLSSEIGIDMLAGPSELLVLADETADAPVVAADLLAQAEHDPDATPILVTTSGDLVECVEHALEEQLAELPTRETARRALNNGVCVLAPDLDEAIRVTDVFAPEHLEILTADPEAVGGRVRNAGALFLGTASAEVLGDYGAGPNHTLPTGGTARYQAGLSVMSFLRLRTWLKVDPESSAELVEDAVRLAEHEGLVGHARSAAKRRGLAR